MASGKKRSLILHPVCFAAHPALFLFSQNVGQLSFASVLPSLLTTLGIASVAWAALAFALKHAQRAGLIVSLALLLYFSHPHVAATLGMGAPVAILTAVWGMLFLAGAWLLLRTRKELRALTQLLNVVGIVVILMSGFEIARFQLTRGTAEPPTLPPTVEREVERPAALPDIYFIILDAYARADVLRELYDFDNGEFLGWLERTGFYVADQAVANYCQTGLTLSSCFNMQYLDEWVKQVGVGSNDHEPLRRSIRESVLLWELRQQGYTTVAFSTGQPETEIPTTDIYIPPGVDFESFARAPVKGDPAVSPYLIPGSKKPFDVFRERIRYIFDHLGRLNALERSPMFVFAHLEVPHPPFVFDADGNDLYPTPEYNDHDGSMLIPERFSREEYVAAYRDQLIFANRRIKRSIEEILANAPQPPVIVLLGDHGPRSQLVWESAEETNHWEALGILYAVHMPDGDARGFYPEISPVNTFRILSNRLFGGSHDLLEDRCYFSTADRLYEFHDVTERARRR